MKTHTGSSDIGSPEYGRHRGKHISALDQRVRRSPFGDTAAVFSSLQRQVPGITHSISIILEL